jgi:hypothetical protein
MSLKIACEAINCSEGRILLEGQGLALKQNRVPKRTRMQKILNHFINLDKLDKIEGIYDDVPEEVYNDPRFPGIRSSFLKSVAKKSYHHATENIDNEDKQHFIDGRIFHEMMEGFSDKEIAAKNSLTHSELRKFKDMQSSAKAHPRFYEIYQGSRKEITMFARCRYTGLLLRCRCDLWNPETNLIADYKTTKDASLEGFSRNAKRFGYRLSACFYSMITSWATGRHVEEFRILAVEKESPYFCQMFSYMRDSFELDTELVVQGLNQIKQATTGGHKGYSTNVIELRY